MKIQNSNYLKDVIEVFPCNIGKVFFYKDLAIVEAKQGMHVCYENTKDLAIKIKDFFGSRKFGLISNRINDYSVEILDYERFYNYLPNLVAHGITYYNSQTSFNVELEKNYIGVPLFSNNNLKYVFENVKIQLN